MTYNFFVLGWGRVEYVGEMLKIVHTLPPKGLRVLRKSARPGHEPRTLRQGRSSAHKYHARAFAQPAKGREHQCLCLW